MIPPQFYFEQGNKQVAPEKYFKNKKGKPVKQGKTLGGIAPHLNYFEQDLTALSCNFPWVKYPDGPELKKKKKKKEEKKSPVQIFTR